MVRLLTFIFASVIVRLADATGCVQTANLPAAPVEGVSLLVCTGPDSFLKIPPRTTQSPECSGPSRQIQATQDGIVYRASLILDSNGVMGFTQSFVVRVRLGCKTANAAAVNTVGVIRSELSPRMWGLCMSDEPARPPLPVSVNGVGTCQGAGPIVDNDYSIVLSQNVRGGPRGIQMKQDRMTGGILDLFGHVCIADDVQTNVFGPSALTGLYNETLLGGDSHFLAFSSDASRNCSTAHVGSPQGRMTTEVQEIGLTVQCNNGDEARDRYIILTGVGTTITNTAGTLTYQIAVDPAAGIASLVNPLVVIQIQVTCPSSISSPNHPSQAPYQAPVPTFSRGTALCGAFCPLPALPRSSQDGVALLPRCCSCSADSDSRLVPNLNDCYDPQPPLGRGRSFTDVFARGAGAAAVVTGAADGSGVRAAADSLNLGFGGGGGAGDAAAGADGAARQTPFSQNPAVNGALIVDIQGCELKTDLLACCNQAYIDILCSTGAYFVDCTCGGVGTVTCPTPSNYRCPKSKKALLALLGLIGIVPAVAALLGCLLLCVLCRSKPTAKGRREPIHAPGMPPMGLVGPAGLGTIASQAPIFM